jgi:hypothetical protein
MMRCIVVTAIAAASLTAAACGSSSTNQAQPQRAAKTTTATKAASARRLVLARSDVPSDFRTVSSAPVTLAETGPRLEPKFQQWGFVGGWSNVYGPQGSRRSSVLAVISIAHVFRTSTGAAHAFAEIKSVRRTIPVHLGDEGLFTMHRPTTVAGRKVARAIVGWRRRQVVSFVEVDGFAKSTVALRVALRTFVHKQDARVKRATGERS